MIKIPMKTVKAGLILAGAHLALFVTGVIMGRDRDMVVPFFYCASLIVGFIGAAPHVPPELMGPGLGVLLSLAVMLPGWWPALPFLLFSVAQLIGTGLVALLFFIISQGPPGPGALGTFAVSLLIPLLHGGGIALVLASRGEPGLASEPPPARAAADAAGEASR
ncbi:MAG: hypothetical protein AAB335_03220 [candidate division NC10 bacterium]